MGLIMEAVKAGAPNRAAALWLEGPLMVGVRQRGGDAERYQGVVLDNANSWTVKAPAPALDPPAGTRLTEVKAPVDAVAGELDQSGRD